MNKQQAKQTNQPNQSYPNVPQWKWLILVDQWWQTKIGIMSPAGLNSPVKNEDVLLEIEHELCLGPKVPLVAA